MMRTNWISGAVAALVLTLAVATAPGAADRDRAPGAEAVGAEAPATPMHAAPISDPDSRDLLAEALARVGATRAGLGVEPHASWTRFPHPARIPYRLPFFDDVYTEPLRLYDLARTMGNTAATFLVPGALDAQPQAMHKLVYFLGVDKRASVFRDYSANLPEGDAPSLLATLEAVHFLAGTNLEARSFGKTGGPVTRTALQREIGALPPAVQAAMARLVAGLADAARWQRLAFRNVPAGAVAACRGIRDLGTSQPDALTYEPAFDDVARTLDEPSLAYAAIKAAQAAQDARTALRAWWKSASSKERNGARELRLAHRTPLGWVIVSGTRDDRHPADGVLALVDLGGGDVYTGGAGAATPDTPVSVCIDLAGNDVYECDDPLRPAQGAGLFGAGILLDADGDDRYTARTLAQGAGFFGVGVLLDESGRDRYIVDTSGQGCGYFGIGLCLDSEGDDDYYAHGDAQGFGGVGGGVGVLADHSGRDHYMAEPWASRVNRGDEHSQGKVNVSNAQGVGSGRRGDGADGHAWAGGLGAILDLHGNDTYESGNWSLGTGYWFGTGIAFDGAGDDMYRSVYFTQAAAAHFANGVLVDEAGDDQHVLYETAGAAMAFGWDWANALLVEKQGDDRYEAKIISLGLAQVRSNALFFDLAGDDQYQLGKDQPGMGAADFRDDYRRPDPLAPYNSEATSFGVLVDAGGADRYLVWDEKTGRSAASGSWGDDRAWLDPAPGSAQHGFRNHGIGLDATAGTVPELVRFDAVPASPTSSR